jgi:IS30 family transposase
MNYNTKKGQLTIVERRIIEKMIKKKFSQSEIAREIGFNRSTVKREIERGSKEEEVEIKSNCKNVPLTKIEKVYRSEYAQKARDEKRKESCKRFNTFKEAGYIKFIEDLVLGDRKLSLDSANAEARRAGFRGVSTKTLYNWVYGRLMKIEKMDLLLAVRRKAPNKVKVQKREYGKKIDERPENANNREEFGHWEGDSIIGAEQKGQIITLLERKRRIGLMFKFNDKRAENMITVLEILRERYKEDYAKIIKSITFDNGSEFAYSERMEATGIRVYYAHAYSSWERGSNENFNGIVRRFIPKGTSIIELTQEDIERINHYINTIPRKILRYKTALEMFREETDKIQATA